MNLFRDVHAIPRGCGRKHRDKGDGDLVLIISWRLPSP
jgi:hypothetical protein